MPDCADPAFIDTGDAIAAPWTAALVSVWRRIEGHRFEPDQALNFTARLARDHGWSIAFARGAVQEYRRFCLLAVASAGPVTPSEEVDEVWHLHLTYSRDYWDVWCGQVLGRALHHDPTEGGPAEGRRYRLQYAQTLALYETFFEAAPAIYWPGTAARFGRIRYQMVDRARWFVLRRPFGREGGI